MDPKKEYKGGPTIGLLHCDLDFSKFNAKVNKDRSNMRLVVREFIFDPKSSIEISFSVILGVLAIISVLLMMAESVDEELFQNFERISCITTKSALKGAFWAIFEIKSKDKRKLQFLFPDS